MVWPGVAALLVVDGDDEQESPGQRHLLGIVSAVGGLTLATAGLALGEVDEGGAALTHSGAALGLLLGGLGEMALQGDADVTVNGEKVGAVRSGYTETELTITDVVRRGAVGRQYGAQTAPGRQILRARPT